MSAPTEILLDSVLPYLEGERIFDIDFTYLLSVLAKPSTILNASKSDINHLCFRVNNYLKSNNTKFRWLGSKLVVVINLHSEILMSNHMLNSMNALIKILETKCFIEDETNPLYQSILTLDSACDALDFLIEKIKGKPTLTREVLTPKLPGIITVLLGNISIIPNKCVGILYKLLLHNSTTFRPFGAKYEKALMILLNDDANYNKFEHSLQSKILKSLVMLSFNLSRSNANDVWRQQLNDLVLEIKSVISIYSEFINLSDDQDLTGNLNSLPKLPEDLSTFKTIFNPLSIDVNEAPLDLLKVSRRLNVLVCLLIEFLKTPTQTTVKIPLGWFVIIGEILVGLNFKFVSVKREIRDSSIRNSIGYAVLESNVIGLTLLDVLPSIFGGDLLPHFHSILSTLDILIPVQRVDGKITVDDTMVYENEQLIVQTLETSISYLNLTELFNDMSLINKAIDSALILTKPRLPQTSEQVQQANVPTAVSNNKNKNKKMPNTISFADLLSHQHLFIINPSKEKLDILRNFFSVILTKCQLTSSKQTEILRFMILDAVKNQKSLNSGLVDSTNAKLIELLESALLFPGYSDTSISVLPMIANLIGSQNQLTSVLTNPRFPLLPIRVKNAPVMAEYEQEFAEQELENEVVEIDENHVKHGSEGQGDRVDAQIKKRKLEEKEQISKDQEASIFKPVGETEVVAPIEISTTNDIEMVDNVIIPKEDVTVVAPAPVPVPEVEDDDDSDLGSDFEIPEIDAGDDEDDE